MNYLHVLSEDLISILLNYIDNHSIIDLFNPEVKLNFELLFLNKYNELHHEIKKIKQFFTLDNSKWEILYKDIDKLNQYPTKNFDHWLSYGHDLGCDEEFIEIIEEDQLSVLRSITVDIISTCMLNIRSNPRRKKDRINFMDYKKIIFSSNIFLISWIIKKY